LIKALMMVLLMSPTPMTELPCVGKSCSKVKKKTQAKTRYRYPKAKNTRARRRTRTRGKTPAQTKKKTTPGKGNAKGKTRKGANTPKKPSGKRNAKSQRRRSVRAQFLLDWTNEILRSDPEIQHIKRDPNRKTYRR